MRGPRNTRKTRKFYRRERREQRALGLINTLLQGGVGRRAKDLNCFSSFPSPLFSPFAPVKSVPLSCIYRRERREQRLLGLINTLLQGGVGGRAKDLNRFSSFPSPLFSPFAPVKSVPFGVFRVFRGLNSGQMAFGKVLKLVTKG